MPCWGPSVQILSLWRNNHSNHHTCHLLQVVNTEYTHGSNYHYYYFLPDSLGPERLYLWSVRACFLLKIQCLGSALTVSNRVCVSHLFECESFLIYFIHLSIFTNISEPSGECAGPRDKHTAVFGDMKLLSGVLVVRQPFSLRVLEVLSSLQGWVPC